MRRLETLILGGGVAGLAARDALAGRECELWEADERVGGLIRLKPRGPYRFDSTAHVIFFRDPAVRARVMALVPGGWYEFAKENLVLQDGHAIPYPYQYNAASLPKARRRECLEGYFRRRAIEGDDFEAWLRSGFGDGFYCTFFEPYNTKLYGVSPRELVAAPMTWIIPPGDDRAVLEGAAPSMVLNSLYPKGPHGVEALALALLVRGTGPVQTRKRAMRIDAEALVAYAEDGDAVRYERLISTLPLPDLLRLGGKEPSPSFRMRPLTVVRVGARRSGPGLPAHWTYLPDDDAPFYRLVRLELISPELAPESGASILLEAGGTPEIDREATVSWLERHGVVEPGTVEVFETTHLPCGYVLFVPGYAEAVRDARVWCGERGIVLAGRFGMWAYMNLEQTLVSGWEAGRER